MNDNVTITGGSNLTTINDEIDLETVYCVATDDYGSSDDMLDVTGMAHSCGLDFWIIYSIIAGAILVVVIVVSFLLRVYFSSQISPTAVIYNVASKAKRNGLNLVRESMNFSNRGAADPEYASLHETV